MKRILGIYSNARRHWVGDGFPVSTLFSYATLGEQASPFLMLDYAGPATFGPSDRRRGVGKHPHRGFETVTIVYEGELEHRDSTGSGGRIGPGDVQWMTSGRGILHEEMPRRGESGTIYGFQLWVNLPSHLKMTEPRYQEVNASTIPTYEKDGVKIRVVAGEVDGVKGPVTEIAASPLYLEVQLAPDIEWTQPIPEGHTTLAYIFEGEGVFADQTVEAIKLIRFEDGDHIRVKTENNPARFMLFAGAPFKEPIVPYGPFVMNTIEEIQQTLSELRNGTFVKTIPQ